MKPKLRILWDYEPDPDFSWLEQWNTKEKYEKDGVVLRDGKPVPWEDYIENEGSPDHYCMLQATVQKQCEACGAWHTVRTLSNCGFGWATAATGAWNEDTLAEDKVHRMSDDEGQRCMSLDLLDEVRAELEAA